MQEDVREALLRWTHPDKRADLDNMDAEFDAIDVNGGGQILLREFLK